MDTEETARRPGLDELELAAQEGDPDAAEALSTLAPRRTAGEEAAERVAAAEMVAGVDERGERTRTLDAAAEDVMDATQWLLGSFNETLPPLQYALLVDVGTPSHPRKIRWVLTSIEREVVEKIQHDAMPQGNRNSRRLGTAPLQMTKADRERQQTAQLRIIIEGTVSPDLSAATKQTGVAAKEEFLREALKRQPGLVEQLANAVLRLSGYDDELLQDDTEARAAGNS